MSKVDASTKVFCVIGDPIEHSLSPAMHNAVFQRLKLNCIYTAFRVKSEDLGTAIMGFKALAIEGINVTIPHKVGVIKYMDELSKEAELIGAVNTVKVGERFSGYNTDGAGALRALRDNGADPNGMDILILGSGGAARAIAVTLALNGEISSLTILGIVEEELKKLKEDINKSTGIKTRAELMTDKIKEEEIKKADLLIHCTPVGMYPNVNETLVTASMLPEDIRVMDIIYTPGETLLMKEAKKAGVETIIGGLDMFVNQGAEALKIWLDIDAPVDLMKDIVIKELEK